MTTEYRHELIARVSVNLSIGTMTRIVPKRYLTTPMGTGASDSRFCSYRAGFTVLYAAHDFATAFTETIVRDRFVRKAQRTLIYKEISERAWARLATQSEQTLKLVDLRADGCLRLGVPTDVVSARNHAAGRALSRSIYSHHTAVDGFVFASRFTGADVYAIFDRALAKLAVIDKGLLSLHNDLPALLRHYEIMLTV